MTDDERSTVLYIAGIMIANASRARAPVAIGIGDTFHKVE